MQSDRSARKRTGRTKRYAVIASAVTALMIVRAVTATPKYATAIPAVSDGTAQELVPFSPSAQQELTVDDDLTDLFLDAEEIDSGVSATYNGKLDIPANVRLDKIDFGTDFALPLESARITSRFDYRVNPVTGRYVFHTGMDLGAPQGASIHAMKAGRVVRAAYDSGYGNFVILEHENGVHTLYAHCSKLLVETGDSVKKGEVIAKVGSTGNSTGPHLHIEFRRDNQRYDPEWIIGGIYD